MKKIKMSLCILLLSLTVVGLAGCSNKNSTDQSKAGGQTTQAETTAGQTTGAGAEGQTGGAGMSGGNGGTSTGGSTENEESSTGVIDGLMDDVENGVDDLTGETTSSAADESR